MIGDRPIWLAASTNKGEEEVLSFVHSKISEKYDNLLTVIVPRHPERCKEILEALKEKNFKISVRSKGEDIEKDTQVYIADTIGEMGIFYRLSGIVFMGGSLVEHGGQNPLESARLQCAILTGPNTDNFKDVYNDLEESNGVLVVKDAGDLAKRIEELLSDHEKQETLAENALNFVDGKSGVIEKYMEYLEPYLNGNPIAGGAGKTPSAIALMSLIKKNNKNLKACFVSKGYGGQNITPLLIDSFSSLPIIKI